MPSVDLGIDELLWLQLHLPRAIRVIQDQVEQAMTDQNEDDEFAHIQMEKAANRTLAAVNHAVEQVRQTVGFSGTFPRRRHD